MYFGKEEMNRPTVGAAIELQTHADPSLFAPVHWNEANVAGQNGVLKLVANHAFAVYVSLKCLEKKHRTTDNTSLYIWIIKHATIVLIVIIIHNPSAPLGHRYYYIIITLLLQLTLYCLVLLPTNFRI